MSGITCKEPHYSERWHTNNISKENIVTLFKHAVSDRRGIIWSIIMFQIVLVSMN